MVEAHAEKVYANGPRQHGRHGSPSDREHREVAGEGHPPSVAGEIHAKVATLRSAYDQGRLRSVDGHAPRAGIDRSVEQCPGNMVSRNTCRGCQLFYRASEDRKSTRLNSSH